MRRTEVTSTGRRRLLAAWLVSILAHAAAAVVLLAGAPGSGAPTAQASLEDPPPPSAPPEDLTLGADRSTATSITWIGFDEYQEHLLTQKSEVDQPELSLDDPAGARPTPAPAAARPAPESDSLADQPPAVNPHQIVAQSAPTPSEPAEPQAPEPVLTQGEPVGPAPEAPMVAVGPEPLSAELAGPLPVEHDGEAPEELASNSEPLDAADTPAPDQPKDTPPQPQPAPAEQLPQPSVPAGTQATGEQADRESDAATVLTATVASLGRPLVSHGLEIQTIRPRFTYYTQITASPKTPVVRIHFDRTGKVYRAQIVRSSGAADVDRPLLDAIYQWRATGKQLDGLSAGNPPGTIAIEIRILL